MQNIHKLKFPIPLIKFPFLLIKHKSNFCLIVTPPISHFYRGLANSPSGKTPMGLSYGSLSSHGCSSIKNKYQNYVYSGRQEQAASSEEICE